MPSLDKYQSHKIPIFLFVRLEILFIAMAFQYKLRIVVA